jgi:hypothetical protein
LARDVEDAAEHAFTDGHRNRRARIRHRHTAHQAFGGGHRDGPRDAAAEMLLDFEREQLLSPRP